MLPSWNILLPQEAGLSFSCEENGTTFIENAMIKARALAEAAGKGVLILSDDSGLCVNALGGGPGIHTARFGMKGGRELESGERNRLLLETLRDVKDRRASFVCALALIIAPHRSLVVEESAKGSIAMAPFGRGGFGYDPIFLVDEAGGRHMAALSDEEKDRYSHRGKACRLLGTFLEALHGNKNKR